MARGGNLYAAKKFCRHAFAAIMTSVIALKLPGNCVARDRAFGTYQRATTLLPRNRRAAAANEDVTERFLLKQSCDYRASTTNNRIPMK